MFHSYAAAVAVAAIGMVAISAAEAAAVVKDPGSGSTLAVSGVAAYDWPDEGAGYPGSEATSPEYNYPNYDPRYEVPRVQAGIASSASADTVTEAVQAGASAVCGAGIAIGAMWVYRRRHAPAT
jgi:hypothetical protein